MIKPIDGVRVSALWEHDQRLLFDLAVKLNEVIAAVNDLAAPTPLGNLGVANPQSPPINDKDRP